MSWIYNFPEHRDAGRGRRNAKQVLKVREESMELVDAALLEREPDERVIEEALDVIHAAETLLRAWPPEEVAKARDLVVAKNAERGYYSERQA